jgi:hypothetical protein
MLNKYVNVTAVLALSSLSYAGQMNVVNETKKEIQVKIQAKGDKAHFVQSIPADPLSSFTVETPRLNGKTGYSLKGHISPFTPLSQCKDLSVEKNYKVTFHHNHAGTTCMAEEEKADSKTTEKAG